MEPELNYIVLELDVKIAILMSARTIGRRLKHTKGAPHHYSWMLSKRFEISVRTS